MAQDIADKLFATTPRTLISMITGTFLIYGVMLTQFATTDKLEAVEMALNLQDSTLTTHIEASTIWQIERVLDDVSDKRWEIKNRLQTANGDKSDLLERDRDLAKRESSYKEQLACLRNGGKYCLHETDH